MNENIDSTDIVHTLDIFAPYDPQLEDSQLPIQETVDPWMDIDNNPDPSPNNTCFDLYLEDNVESFEGDLHLDVSNSAESKWKPVFVSLKESAGKSVLHVFHSPPADCASTFELGIEHYLSPLKETQFSEFSKAFSVKIIRKILSTPPKLSKLFDKKFILAARSNIKGFLERDERVIKLCSLDYSAISLFVAVFEHLRMKCASDPTPQSIQVENVEMTVLNILKMGRDRNLTCRLFYEGNLTDWRTISVGLNVKQRRGKEIVDRADIMAMRGTTEDVWVTVDRSTLHRSVNVQQWTENGILQMTHPIIGHRVELLRTSNVPVPLSFVPPIMVLATMSVVHNKVIMEVKLEVNSPWNYSGKYLKCRNIVVRVPFPDEWCYYFSRVKFYKRKGAARVHSAHDQLTSSASPVHMFTYMSKSPLAVTTGLAKYEQLHQAIVWKMDGLPLRNIRQETHMMKCTLELEAHDKYPQTYRDLCHLSYELETSMAFNLFVRTISVAESPGITRSAVYRTFVEDEFTAQHVYNEENSL